MRIGLPINTLYHRPRSMRFGTMTLNPDADVLFDPNNNKTVTTAKTRSIKWNNDAETVADNCVFGVLTVYDNSFGYKEVFNTVEKQMNTFYPKHKLSLSHKEHCEFCGQRIMYVAVLISINKTDSSKISTHSIGCDCLGKIFGLNWYGYRNAEVVKKKLIAAAKVRSRKEKYAVEYKKEIAWVNGLSDPLLNKSRFLVDMKNILTTGKIKISDKMLSYFRKLMVSDEYDPKKVAKHNLHVDESIKKVEMILEMVTRIDGDKIHDKWSAYGFVTSILAQVRQFHRLTPNQMLALNKVFIRYRDMENKNKQTVDLTKFAVDNGDTSIPY